MPLIPLLVFTDLDGTLLDHHSYDHAPAQPALDALAQMGAGVVLASSKTAAEIAPLRDRLGLTRWPAIVENGAGLLEPGAGATGEAEAWQAIRAALDALPHDLRAPFTGFGDMDDAGVADATGLPLRDAALARKRQFSEPGTWAGDDALRKTFLTALADQGITARMGGRFLTLSHGATKADRMAQIIDTLQPARTVALGDAPNDVEMLQAADIGVIVANPQATPLPELPNEQAGRIIRTQLPGPQGWNRAMLDLLSDGKTE